MSLKSYHNLLYKAWVGPFALPLSLLPKKKVSKSITIIKNVQFACQFNTFPPQQYPDDLNSNRYSKLTLDTILATILEVSVLGEVLGELLAENVPFSFLIKGRGCEIRPAPCIQLLYVCCQRLSSAPGKQQQVN